MGVAYLEGKVNTEDCRPERKTPVGTRSETPTQQQGICNQGGTAGIVSPPKRSPRRRVC